MHIANIVIGAAVALPALCLGAPIEAIPNSLNQRAESMSRGGPLEAGVVVNRNSDTTQENEVKPLGVRLGWVLKRDSDTDEVPAETGIFI